MKSQQIESLTFYVWKPKNFRFLRDLWKFVKMIFFEPQCKIKKLLINLFKFTCKIKNQNFRFWLIKDQKCKIKIFLLINIWKTQISM